MPNAIERSFHQIDRSSFIQSKEIAPPKAESIFKYFDVSNEVLFVRNLIDFGLPKAERDFYVRENAYRFLGEFVGKIPYTTVSYVLKDDGLYYGDINTTDVYEATAQMTSEGSREWAEYAGHENTFRLLHEEDSPIIAFSPPKIADYSFAFVWTKGEFDEELGGTPIEMRAIRYKEPMESIEATARAAQELIPDIHTDHFPDANSYIASPFVLSEDLRIQDVARILGVDSPDVERSQLFEEAVRVEMEGLVEHWIDEVEVAALIEKETVEYQKTMSRLETILAGIFNAAGEIREKLEAEGADYEMGVHSDFIDRGVSDEVRFAYFARLAGQKEATVVGGGSCPVTNDESSDGLRRELRLNRTIEDILHRGINATEDSASHYNNYACPHCRETIPGELKGKQEEWRTHCPHCDGEIDCRE